MPSRARQPKTALHKRNVKRLRPEPRPWPKPGEGVDGPVFPRLAWERLVDARLDELEVRRRLHSVEGYLRDARQAGDKRAVQAFSAGRAQLQAELEAARQARMAAQEQVGREKRNLEALDLPADLLERALASGRERWYTGQTVWLVGRRVYLSDHGNRIGLHVTGYAPYVNPLLVQPAGKPMDAPAQRG